MDYLRRGTFDYEPLLFICKLPPTINHNEKKNYVFFFFVSSLLSSDGDKHQTCLIFHGYIIVKLRKIIRQTFNFISYTLRSFNIPNDDASRQFRWMQHISMNKIFMRWTWRMAEFWFSAGVEFSLPFVLTHL